MASRKERKSSPVLLGKCGVEWATISVWWCPSSLSKKRIARPRGLAFGEVSGILGRPLELEKRTRTGVTVAAKCGAFDRVAASDVEVNVPFTM